MWFRPTDDVYHSVPCVSIVDAAVRPAHSTLLPSVSVKKIKVVVIKEIRIELAHSRKCSRNNIGSVDVELQVYTNGKEIFGFQVDSLRRQDLILEPTAWSATSNFMRRFASFRAEACSRTTQTQTHRGPWIRRWWHRQRKAGASNVKTHLLAEHFCQVQVDSCCGDVRVLPSDFATSKHVHVLRAVWSAACV